MPDNVALPATGETIATDLISSVHYPISKSAHGIDGEVALTSKTAPMPTGGATMLQADAGLNANDTATVGTALELLGARRVGLQVDGATGTHATHVVTIQVSADGTTYHNSSATVTGEGVVELDTAFPYAKAKVTTAEGGTSTININLNAK